MIGITLFFMLLSIYLGIHLLSLKKGLQKLREDFREIKQNNVAERHVQFHIPDKDLEDLAEELNQYIADFYEQVDAKRKDILRLKDEITNLSHDLRTPLTSVLGYVELIKQEDLSDEQKEIFEVITRRSNQLNELVEQLYEYARLGNKDYAFHMEKLDFYRIVKEHLLDAYMEFEANKITLDLSLPRTNSPWMILADQIAIKRILTNLISNTLKYANEYAKIELALHISGVELIFCTNKGGLTEFEIAHLFERYFKGNKTKTKRQSSGLGLTITKLFVEQMGGDIKAFGDEKDLFISCYFPLLNKDEVS